MERHLATCRRCRAELAELAPLPGLLGRLDAAEVRSQALTPGPDLLARTLAAVRAAQAAEHRRLRRWRVGAAAAAAAALVATAAAVVPAVLPDVTTPAVPFTVAAAGARRRGRAAWSPAAGARPCASS
ncbi:hypothetical protein BJF78_10770 [Pseudonocardia sp. CNS-139]|nr:hypothetical protein BJF78_10770 [Pseudonocardia sp. CNS-139]